MKLGILSDSHDKIERTRAAVELLQELGAETLVHCGDLFSPEIVEVCAALPFYFVFGNHDADVVPDLNQAAETHGAHCLGWGGEFLVEEKRVAVVHGHLKSDLQPLLDSRPDYLLSGHSHLQSDCMAGDTRRINPGALHRAKHFTVAVLDTATDKLDFHALE